MVRREPFYERTLRNRRLVQNIDVAVFVGLSEKVVQFVASVKASKLTCLSPTSEPSQRDSGERESDSRNRSVRRDSSVGRAVF